MSREFVEESKAEVSARHKREWHDLRVLYVEPLYGDDADLEKAKMARALADILKISQEGERKAWGFGEGEDAGPLDVQWNVQGEE